MRSSWVLLAAAMAGALGCEARDNPLSAFSGGRAVASIRLVQTAHTVPVGMSTQLEVQSLDAAGTVIPGIDGHGFVSSAPEIASVGQSGGVVTGLAVGSSTVTVTLVRDGLTHTATASVSVTDPATTPLITASGTDNAFVPRADTVPAGSAVVFRFMSRTHNVTFTAVAGAPPNIPNSTNTTHSRIFSTVGLFPFRCTLHSETGEIRVQ